MQQRFPSELQRIVLVGPVALYALIANATAGDLFVHSSAVNLWHSAGKQIRAPIRKEVRPTIDEYQRTLTSSDDAVLSETHDQMVQANVAAQETLKKAVEQSVENNGVRIKELRVLAQVHEALKVEEKTIREASTTAPHGTPAPSISPAPAPIYPSPRTQDPGAEWDQLMSQDVALAIYSTPQHELKGTGFLIGRNLLLTAGHVLGGRDAYVDAKKYEVLSEQRNNNGTLDQHRYPLGQRIAYGKVWPVSGNDLDFALFEVDPCPDADGTGSVTVSQHVKQTRTLTCVGAQRQDPVYIVGYPEAAKARSVSEGTIIYPYHVNPADMGAEIMYWAYHSVPEGYGPVAINRLYKTFVDAHLQDGSRTSLVLKVGAPGVQPVYGAEINAYPGHSGSPVFSKDSRQIVGIYLGGKGPGGTVKNAIWPEMEFVLPIEPVLNQLDHDPQLAGWEEKYGVVVIRDAATTSQKYRGPMLVARDSP